ncbi:Ankrd17, partial [Symbiodinium pilosum]
SLALKLCSPQGLLSEGTGGMPISYILKVSSAISTLDLQSAECESASEKEMLLQAIERLAGSVATASSRCRQLLQDGLSVMHQRGQQIFVQAVSWLKDAKLDVPKGTVDYTEQSALTGDAANTPEPLPETSEAHSRNSSKTSSPDNEESGHQDPALEEPEEEQSPEREEQEEHVPGTEEETAESPGGRRESEELE